MPLPRARLLVAVTGAAALLAAVPGLAVAGETAGVRDPMKVVQFLGEQRLPTASTFQGTTIGGLSGLDRDPKSGTWFIISDDRSQLQPARFYTADIAFAGQDGALSGVTFYGTTPLRRPDGSTYPPLSAADGTTPDPEDVRVDPITGQLAWSQEGERIVPTDGKPPTLIDPTVRFAERDGSFGQELPVPESLQVSAGQTGMRQNLGPEGLTFTAAGGLVVSALEGPLLQDGPLATTNTGQRSRIVVQTRTGKVVAQYAYDQEPVFADSTPTPGKGSTGVTAILSVDGKNPNKFLVLERSFVGGVGNKVRIFEVDSAGATRLDEGTPTADAKPVRKQLIADLADFPVKSVDNIEGMAWGPDRADGSRTLVLVSDDNFAASQVTQFIALAVR